MSVPTRDDILPIVLEPFSEEEGQLLTTLTKKYSELSRLSELRRLAGTAAFIIWAVAVVFMVTKWEIPASELVVAQMGIGFLVSIGGGIVFGIMIIALLELCYCRHRRREIRVELITIRDASPETWPKVCDKLRQIKRARAAVSPYDWRINGLVGEITSADMRRAAARTSPITP